MGNKWHLLLTVLYIVIFLHHSNGQCQIGGGLMLGPVPNHEFIQDVYRGIIRSETTTNIDRIADINYGGALVGSEPYLDINLANSQLVIQTSNAFALYEENETALSISVTIQFSCTGGTTSPLILVINIEDTNNNYPEFIPTNEFAFVLAPPLPPGFLITGCLNEITVKDIDLTTSSIIFEVEDNPYVEIEYDPVASTAAGPKHFKALLKTSTFIRTLREPITLRITATDVDATNDPPLSTNGIIRISADTEFEFPEEPVFSQTYYFATYTDEHQLIQHDTISLQQGFDEYVNFALDGDGEYSSYFSLNADGNQVSLGVNTPLPIDVLVQKQIYLIVRASREFTSGDSATIVIHLPEETPLLFENALYEGSIIDNVLQLPPLVLSQGYEGSVTARIVGEYSSSFTAAVQGNLVTLTMVSLTDSIIENNNFLSIPVQASTDRSEATTIVSLDIIKDDTGTPLFDEPMYKGSYDPVNGLTLGQITFVQGFDETILVELNGVHKELFQLNQEGPTIRLTSSVIPPELFEEQQIMLTIEATKPRTVGANAAIIITLPAPRELSFEEASYRGTIKDSELVHQTILLSEGFDQNVRFTHGGDYADYFDITNIQNQVTITLSDPLPESVINQNTVIMLTLTASGLNAISATTSVLFDIIKEDSFTPVLNKKIYYGTYRGPTDFEIENIYLTQGFADDVLFKLDDSAHAQYFEISNTGNSATIRLRSAIPEDVIFNEKVLLFNVIADKALTVGSNAAVLIRFPAELTESTVMRFSENYYVGDFEQNKIEFSKTITLEIGYEIGTEFKINGDYADHFELSSVNNVIQISSNIENSLPLDVIENNEFIVLTVEALRERAIPVETTVIIDIVKEQVEIPVFNQSFYRGLYTTNNELQFQEDIHLSEGYDDTVNFELDGEQATWFSIIKEGNSATLVLNSPIPKAVLDDNNQLLFTILALKPNEVSGRAVVSIDLPNEIINFSEDFYKGYIEDGIPVLEVLSIPDFIIPSDVEPSLSGDHSEYFQFRNQEGNLLMELRTPIPDHILEENDFLIFTLEIQVENKNIKTVIVLEIVRTENIVLMFEKLYYVGLYDESTGLEFDDDIRINEVSFDTISFDLHGDDAQWFDLVRGENSVKLVLSEPIPSTVLSTNQQLIFEVVAVGLSGSAGRAAIIISLPAQHIETSVLLFDQVNYLGTIENNEATIEPITLSEGYVPVVQFTLQGELRDYFELSAQGAAVTVTLSSPIPEQSIPSNRIVLLEIHASAPQTVSAYATLVIECVVEDDNTPVVELVFAQTYYTGTYTEADGLTFTTPISLSDGYDEDVQFSLEEDNSEWFTLVGTGNSRILELSSPIPAAVLANNQQLIFIVKAQRPGSTSTRAAIIISLTAELTEGLVLGFDKVTYRGSIENNEATIEPITLSEGYVPGVQFSLQGELRDYFELSAQGAAVTVTLSSSIPEQSIPSNRIVLLEIHASAPQTVSAYATLVIECVVEDDNTPVVELVFAQTYYTGTYTEADGLTFTTPISLSDGYDEDVQFSLEEDNSEWFTLVGTGNSRILELSSPIPAAVLANNQQLIFIVEAQRPGSTSTRAAIVISLTAELTEGLVLGFDKVTYRGSIENNEATIEPITLSEGYVPGVQFSLQGELRDYFELSAQGATVTVTLSSSIPEQSIPSNRIVLLEIHASAPQTVSAYATLVIECVVEDDNTPVVELVFAQTYYTGTYTEADGLTFTTPISLSDGYDEDVQFSLEEDNSEWFTLVGTGNSRILELSSPIPAAVLANNQQLIFIVEAQRPGSTSTRAAIVISLTAELTEGLVLGFDKVTYRGSIENNEATIEPITLSEGYVPGVQFSLQGELRDYFELSAQGAAVTVTLSSPIPEQSIPSNRIVLLEIHASAPQTVSAYATLVIECVVEDDNTPVVELVFAQTYYTGTYTEADGLTFTTPISLSDGYDEDVQFSLEEDNSEWFTLVGTGNSRILELSSPIPAAVLANNQQLIFIVEAQRPGSSSTRAAIVISLTAELTEGLVLGFDKVTYRGSIENNEATIEPITLSEGYVPGVQFSLQGELRDYFELSAQGAAVTVTLSSPIPEQSIPSNRIVLLEIHASAPQTVSAYATLVIECVVEDDNTPVVELVFAQTYYTGTYTEADGLTFTTPISLSDGYDEDVQFSLEEDNSEWFTLVGTGNSRILELSSPIPAAVLANNQQLIFIVEAQRPGSTSTRAAIVISLTAELTEGLVLGFDKVTYRGSIENNEATIEPITLSEGYVPGVQFSLQGELRDYFELSAQGAAVTVTLSSPIPEQSIPSNRIVLLEIHASAPQTVSAYATLVIECVVEDDNTPVVELVFAQTYYTGTYTEADGLTFTTPISLSDGYDEDVQFSLEEDNSEWFILVGTGNSRILELSSPIPAAVLANNQQLIFIVEAQRPGSTSTRAAIVISLTAELTEGLVLGFDKVTYRGSIENNEATIEPITLSEGYVPGVQFSLQGELRDYFELSAQGAAVTVTLSSPIPEQSIPSNRIVLLEIHASAPQTVSAYATLVIECVVEDDNTPVVELVFAQTYYTGTYTEADGLTFTTPISLSDGYDEDVQFSLEEDNSEWFTLVGTGNSRILELSSPIPAAVLANNQQLIFIVEAQRPGSTSTRAAIVISLTAELTEGLVLGFDKVTYRGSIENNEATIEPITLSEGYVPGVQFSLQGELRDYFELSAQGAAVTVTLSSPIPEQSIPSNRIVLLEIHASAPQTVSAYATLVIECVVEDDNTPVVELVFAQTYYTGTYTEADGLTFTTPISLSDGYDEDVQFSLEEDNSEWFTLVGTGNSRILELSSPIPAAVLANNQQLIFIVEAQRPGSTSTRAAIVISLTADSQGSDLSFAKVIFEGVIENGAVLHETITITGFSGTSSIELDGVYSSLFEADFVNGEVTVRATGPLTLPAGLTHLTLELQAETARAVLVLAVSQSDEPTVPVVRFNSASYAVSVEITVTGLVGQVQASADNGEAVLYSIQTNNVHLQERLSVNDDGELYLSAPVNSGLYTFQVIATTIFTQQTATATVHLSAEAVTVCGDEIVMPPLIVLDRDEEEPHYNLINTYEGCQFHLTNRWPFDQTWIYVDETGLHTRPIDREHESIAFMTLSQVQVEITLHCDTDETRVRRSPTYDSPDPYDYGDNKWVLADTILYNSRRSLVNLIVNDINDNAPVFVGKENEPIAVGYPVAELEQRVLPRSLAELQATDADIGENAALIYWSLEPELAVAPTNGFVHIRDGAKLENDARLTVHATDQNRQGLTGSIELVVRLLDESNILVVTVRDAFLNNEKTVLTQISESVGYEIKVLRSIVISENENNDEVTRKTRDVTSTTGTLLQLYVYGLIDREPVSVEQLMTDISTAEVAQVNIASTVSLEDHLAGQEICAIPGRDTGLLVATIVLSVLLFIVIVLIAVWFFLRWRRNQNYDQFSDNNSIASRSEPIDHGLKPVDVVSKPRLNIEQLRKSEKRLQEMLDAPIPEVTVEPTPSTSNDAVLDMPDTNSLIVIQSKLKDANAANDELSDDEYGERKTPKRKSVVTFNENVEKIIHVEEGDEAEDRTAAGYEIYKL